MSLGSAALHLPRGFPWETLDQLELFAVECEAAEMRIKTSKPWYSVAKVWTALSALGMRCCLHTDVITDATIILLSLSQYCHHCYCCQHVVTKIKVIKINKKLGLLRFL